MIALILRLKIFLVFIFFCFTTLSTAQECSSKKLPCYLPKLLFEVKTGYFFFSNSKLRKIYAKGGLDIQLCSTYPVCNLTQNWSLHAYGAIEYFHRSGHSLNGKQKTDLWSIPINIGLKPIYLINPKTKYYLAIGPRYFFMHQNNHSSYINKKTSKNGVGFFANTGINYILCDHFVVDIFGEYSYAKMHLGGKSRVYARNMQVGGFTFGGGFGYKF